MSFKSKISEGRIDSISLKQVTNIGLKTLHYNHPGESFSLAFTDEFNCEIPFSDHALNNRLLQESPFYFYWLPKDEKADNITIRLRGLDKDFKLCVNRNKNLSELNQLISKKLNKKMDNLIIQNRDCDLKQSKTFSEYGFQEEQELNFYCNNTASGKGFFFASMADDTLKEEMPSYREGDDHLQITEGTNILGKCQEQSCPLNGEQVVAKIGFDKIEYPNDVEGKFCCPQCNEQIIPLCPVFFNCKYQWSGIQIIDKKRKPIQMGDNQNTNQICYKEVSDGKYIISDLEKDTCQTKWAKLLIRSFKKGQQQGCSICGGQVDTAENFGKEIKCFQNENHFVHFTCQIQLTCEDSCVLCFSLKESKYSFDSQSTQSTEIEQD